MQLNIDLEVAKLRRMTAGQLREHYAKIMGEETRSRHKTYLIRRIIWRLQAEGDLSIRARRRAEQLANDAEVRVTPPRDMALPAATGATVMLEVSTSHDSRLPTPGMSIRRQYKGRTVVVNVHSDGFEFNGQHYKSLSAVAKAITGSHCNGFRFFGLGENTGPENLQRIQTRQPSPSAALFTPASRLRRDSTRTSIRWMPSARRPNRTSKARSTRAGNASPKTTTTAVSPVATSTARPCDA
jgi:hypothetical protein